MSKPERIGHITEIIKYIRGKKVDFLLVDLGVMTKRVKLNQRYINTAD